MEIIKHKTFVKLNQSSRERKRTPDPCLQVLISNITVERLIFLSTVLTLSCSLRLCSNRPKIKPIHIRRHSSSTTEATQIGKI